MAVSVRLRSRGMPARSAPAAFTIASTPTQVTGGWSRRIKAVYGTEPIYTPGPSTAVPVPPGTTTGHTAAVPELWPTWSVVMPSLPRNTPWAGYAKPLSGGFVASVANPPQDRVVRPAIRVRTGGGVGRITTNPKALIRWVRQGG